MTPNALTTAIRNAAANLTGAQASSRRRMSSVRLGFLCLSLVSLGACSDLTAPRRSIDREAVATVSPALTDARMRLATGIKDIAIRQKVVVDLAALDVALRGDNVQRAQDNLQSVASTLNSYRLKSTGGDAGDISAIFLMLNAVSVIVDAGNPVSQ